MIDDDDDDDNDDNHVNTSKSNKKVPKFSYYTTVQTTAFKVEQNENTL